MHETMVAESLLAMISAEAEKQHAKPVSAKVSCGTLDPINDEILRFAFSAIAKDTECADVELQIEHKSIQGQCKSCNNTFDVDFSQPGCTKCGSEVFKLLADAPLLLEEIEFQTE